MRKHTKAKNKKIENDTLINTKYSEINSYIEDIKIKNSIINYNFCLNLSLMIILKHSYPPFTPIS